MNHIFVRNSIFCQNLPNFNQNFRLQDFFCDSIHGLHLCYNFGDFNIDIDNFIGKNSLENHQKLPLYFLYFLQVKSHFLWNEKISHIVKKSLSFECLPEDKISVEMYRWIFVFSPMKSPNLHLKMRILVIQYMDSTLTLLVALLYMIWRSSLASKVKKSRKI